LPTRNNTCASAACEQHERAPAENIAARQQDAAKSTYIARLSSKFATQATMNELVNDLGGNSTGGAGVQCSTSTWNAADLGCINTYKVDSQIFVT
jgi:hypothetical protein